MRTRKRFLFVVMRAPRFVIQVIISRSSSVLEHDISVTRVVE